MTLPMERVRISRSSLSYASERVLQTELYEPSCANKVEHQGNLHYFLDQLGDSFCPWVVSSRALVPSASIDQICRVPVRVDSNTMWRPSGAQLGRSFRPWSLVNSTSCWLTMSMA